MWLDKKHAQTTPVELDMAKNSVRTPVSNSSVLQKSQTTVDFSSIMAIQSSVEASSIFVLASTQGAVQS